jgi:hypothetical protein
MKGEGIYRDDLEIIAHEINTLSNQKNGVYMKAFLISVFIMILLTLSGMNLVFGTVNFSDNPDWQTTDGPWPGGIAWSDIDGNSWPDLVIGAGTDAAVGPIMIYYNYGNGIPQTPDWTSEYIGHACMILPGDLDNDGDFDLVVPSLGDFGSWPPQVQTIYYNDNGFPSNPDWYSDPMNAYCGALGDPDGDGDLDIVFADGGGSQYAQYLKLFLNNDGVFGTEPDWQSDSKYNTIDASFIDIYLVGELYM